MSDVINEVAWQVVIRKSDIEGMNNEAKTEFITELMEAVQTVCWRYGVHN